LRAWGLVFIGNLVGVVATEAVLILACQHPEHSGGVAVRLLDSAARIEVLAKSDAALLGLLGTTLLCLGVWLTYSTRSTTRSR
jgi:formate/nitrite transporter FocA (FNT family)